MSVRHLGRVRLDDGRVVKLIATDEYEWLDHDGLTQDEMRRATSQRRSRERTRARDDNENRTG